MMRSATRTVTIAAALLCASATIAGCTAERSGHLASVGNRPGGSPHLTLAAFNDCTDLLKGVRSAAKAAAGPYGLPGGSTDEQALAAGSADGARKAAEAGPNAAAAPNAAAGSGQATRDDAAGGRYSSSNNYEADADEPDLVKTDGHRIVTVARGVLHVVDAASRRQTGSLELGPAIGQPSTRPVGAAANLLLVGDHALVLFPHLATLRQPPRAEPGTDGRSTTGGDANGKVPPPDDRAPDAGPRLVLVDVTGTPRVLATYAIDGTLIDARRTGSAARVVVSSRPRIAYRLGIEDDAGVGPRGERSKEQRTAEVRAAIDATEVEGWLPRYATAGPDGRSKTGHVGCASVRRPAEYSGTTMLTVLTFDLKADSLGDGQPVGIVADGDTVYSTGSTMYVANDARWRSGSGTARTEPRTDLYQFDTSGTGRPRYVASGSVPGWLINQYALSEWDGHLRAATTNGTDGGGPQLVDDGAAEPAAGPDGGVTTKRRAATTESAVYVLRRSGEKLSVVGSVGGLGRGERIYAVRFVGATGYVVTFRQTDPLYAVDLRDPGKPKVTGELKITGYSAYLHPIDGNRLIGVGQQATETGRRQGAQVSLFDVADAAQPKLLANHVVPQGTCEVESDPHAFLYWPKAATVVVPVTTMGAVPGAEPAPAAGTGVDASTRANIASSFDAVALVLGIGPAGITERGKIRHDGKAMVRRSLVIGDTLWTVSDAGLRADDLGSLANRGWLPW